MEKNEQMIGSIFAVFIYRRVSLSSPISVVTILYVNLA